MNESGLAQPRVSRVLVERYVARLRKRRRWRRLAVTLSVLTVLLAGSVYYIGWHTRILDVRATRITGTEVLTAAQVIAAAKVPPHQPLAAVDLGAIRSRVGAIPRVASVTVTRDWPHTIVVRIVERTPAAALPDSSDSSNPSNPSGSFTLVDVNGVAFDTAATADALPPHVPIIRLQQSADSADSTADPATVRATVISGALAALRALPDAVRSRVTGIAATGPFGITLDLAPATPDGKAVTVDWGGGDEPDLKARVLTALLGQPAIRYDVSAPEAPAYS